MRVNIAEVFNGIFYRRIKGLDVKTAWTEGAVETDLAALRGAVVNAPTIPIADLIARVPGRSIADTVWVAPGSP